MSHSIHSFVWSRALAVPVALAALLLVGLLHPLAAEELPAPGMFLVAKDDMRDPNFSETVVLLARYDPHGALGIVLNRATDVRVSRGFPALVGPGTRTQIYGGGPVETGQWAMLIRADTAPEDALHVFEDVYLTDDPDLLERFVADADARGKFRVYAGYAGWGPGQLDAEIARGGWHVIAGDAATIFSRADAETWRELLPRDPRKWTRLLVPDGNAVEQFRVAELGR